ncbi:MAG: hypothetical protein ABI885_24865 [Gammaproteobacteria bacterium]
MLIRKKLPRAHGLNEPIRHRDNHKPPVTRRDFIAAGMISGPATIAATGLLGLLANPRFAHATGLLSDKLVDIREACSTSPSGASGTRKIPFICFDLAGGANLTGSEVLIGQKGGQLDFLSTAGYGKLGLPGDMTPNSPNAASPTNNFINTAFGLAFHSDAAIVRGMLERTSPTTQAGTNGAAIAARSENDTGNNPHNPMAGIAHAGASGTLLQLVGSQSSDSGGNSMSPLAMLALPDVERPTKVSQASDVTGLVDTGDLAVLLPQKDAVSVLESMATLSGGKLDPVNVDANSRLGRIDMGTRNGQIQSTVRCAYVKTADLADRFGDPASLNPDKDPDVVDQSGARGAGIFGQAEYQADGEFRKTAAVMKMVVDGYAGAGCITLGGYDYHDSTRASGEMRNFRAGRCIGAVLEYAARKATPVMIYVFSDGSLSSSSMVDNTVNGRGKLAWQGDNQATASSFFLVFNPGGRPVVNVADPAGGLGKQIGYFRADGSVETASHPGANAVNLLVETVILNWMALHGQQGDFPMSAFFPGNGLGGPALRDSLTAFAPIAPSGFI